MMLKKMVFRALCAGAVVAQVALAQEDSAAGLLSQLASPAPVGGVKPVAPAARRTPGELNAMAVPAPAPAETPAAPVVTPPVKPPEVKAPAVSLPVVPPRKPAAPAVAPVKPPEVKAPAVSVPDAVQQPGELPAVTAKTNKPTLTIAQPKKRLGGASLLSRAAASTNASQRETVITSDKIDFDNREGVILFDDNVYVDDPQFNMRTDRLLVFMQGTNDVSQVMAIGHVTFSNEMRSATCSKAVYTRKDGQIVLTGDVRLKTEGSTAGEVRGNRVVIWVDDERVEVLEGATITLPPGTFKKANDHKK